MNQDAKDEVTQFIHDEYLGDFLDVYGLTIAIAEKHPEQVNNEIRNSLTHLARALAADLKDYLPELELAKKHLQRAKRDCLKLSIIYKRDQLMSSVYRIERHEGAIPRALKARLSKIESDRRKIFKKESAGEAVVEDLQNILADAIELGDIILENHQDPGAAVSRLKRIGGVVVHGVQLISTSIVVALVSGYLLLVLIPENSNLVVNSRELITSFIETILPIQDEKSPANDDNL